MKCFEVTINGEKVCTAGVGDDGVLVSTVQFVKRNNPDETADSQDNEISETLNIRVGGIANREADEIQHLEWLQRDLRVGDEIIIRIIEASSCDDPTGKEVSYLECSFCGSKQAEVSKLIAGPAVFICNKCVGDCTAALDRGEPTGNITIVVPKTADVTCSFCGKKPTEVEGIVGVSTALICNECLKICGDILVSDV